MIILYACEKLSASITQQQCKVNKTRDIDACKICSGLGQEVARFEGTEQPKRIWGRTASDYGSAGAEVRKKNQKDKASLRKMQKDDAKRRTA